MSKKQRKSFARKLWSSAERRIQRIISSRKAVSVVVSTVVLSAGVLALGIAVLYWAFSMGNLANLQYSRAVANDSYAVSERIAFEYISYDSSSQDLTVNIMNWGTAKNVNISLVYLWDNFHNPIGTGAYTPSTLRNITNGSPILNNVLNSRDEGSFTIHLNNTLPEGYYNIRLVTPRGRTFDTSFIV